MKNKKASSNGPEVIVRKGHIVNRRTVLGAIGGGVVAAALGDRFWPLVATAGPRAGRVRRHEPVRRQCRRTAGLRHAGRLYLPLAHQARRRHPRRGPALRQDAGLDLLLELRRHLPHLAPPGRLPVGRPVQGLRVRQLDPGRRERADLRHPDPRSSRCGLLEPLRPGQPHLPRPLRRPADGPGRGRRRDAPASAWASTPSSIPTPTASPAPTARRTSPPSSTARRAAEKQQKTKVLMAFRADWIAATTTSLDGGGWIERRHAAPHAAGRAEGDRQVRATRAPRATRSTGKWCRWPSCWSSTGQIPGDSPRTLSRPRRRRPPSRQPLLGHVILRMCRRP